MFINWSKRERVNVVNVVGGIRGLICKFVMSGKTGLQNKFNKGHIGPTTFTTFTRSQNSLLGAEAGGFKAEFLLWCVYVVCFMNVVNYLIAMTEVICLVGYQRVFWA
jgi:hypothetical protein